VRAIVKTHTGVAEPELCDKEVPVPPPGWVRIKIKFCGLCGTDIHILSDEYPNNPPVVLGHEIAGQVVEGGKGVRPELVGTRVTARTMLTCGTCQYCRIGKTNLCLARRSIGSSIDGGFAEYMIIPEDNLHVLPETIDYEEGALSEPLACCVRAILEIGRIRAGEQVLVIGPGTIGLLCTQLAKLSGAVVTVIGTPEDEQRLHLAGKLGANCMLTTDDLDSLTRKPRFQTAVECSGSPGGLASAIQLVQKNGRIIQVGLTGKPVPVPTDSIALKEIVLLGTFAHNWTSWHLCMDLLAQGELQLKPMITEIFPLEDYPIAFEAFQSRKGLKILLQPGE